MEIQKERSSLKSKNPSTLVTILVFVFIALIGMFFGDMNLIDSQVVHEEKPWFNVNIEIPRQYKQSTTEVLTTIKLVNLGGEKRIDVILDYTIENSIGNTILNKQETVAIETQASLVRYFTLPEGLPEDIYSINVVMSSLDGKVYAIASDSFEVVKTSKNNGFFSRVFSPILSLF